MSAGRRVWVALVVLVILAGAVWSVWSVWSVGRFAGSQRGPDVPVLREPAAARPGLPVAAAEPAIHAAAPAVQARPPEPAPGPRVVELCGIGRMPLQPEAGLTDPQELPAHLLAQPLEQARQRLLQALAAGDSRMRGAALFMQGADAAAALRQLALTGTDPALVRWALARCPSQEATCRQALTAHAQALEPGNAAAWQDDLTHRGRPPAEVLAHMAAADRHVLHFGHLPALVASAPPADLLPYLRQALVLEAIGLEAAIALPAYQPLVKHCKPGLEAGSGLQQQCEHIARLMVEQGDTLLARGIGLRIAERAGWSAARLSAARAETQALVKASPWPVDEQPMGCAAVSWTLGWAKDLGRAGEVPLLRQRLAAASAPR